MAAVFKKIDQLDALYVEASGKKIDLLAVNIIAMVGSTPTCNIRFASGTRVYTSKQSVFNGNQKNAVNTLSPGTACRVCVTINGSNYVIFKGRVSGTAVAYNTTGTTVNSIYSVVLAFEAEHLDSIPIASTSLLSRAGGNKSIVSSSFSTMGASSLLVHVKSGKKPTVNVAAYIRDVMDGVCYTDAAKKNHIGNVAGGSVGVSKVIDVSTCPAMRLTEAGEQIKFCDIVAEYIISMLERGNNYWSTFVATCAEFFLTVVPDISTGLMKVMPALAWNKKIDVAINADNITSSQCVMHSKGRNEVDAVVVSYNPVTQTSQGTSVDPIGTIVYGEGIKGNKPCAITDPNDLVEKPGNPPRKYITRMAPAWVMRFGEPLIGRTTRVRTKKPQDRVCSSAKVTSANSGWNSFALKWCSIIARTTFAQLNRAQAKATLGIRLLPWLSLAKMLGKIAIFEDPADFLAPDQPTPIYVGYIAAATLSIQVAPAGIQIRPDITLSHVRTKEENDILGIEESVYVR